MTAADFMAVVEAAAHAVAFFQGKAPERIYVSTKILREISNRGLFDLPQVAQAQVAGTFRVLRRIRLETGVVEVHEDSDEPLFRFEFK